MDVFKEYMHSQKPHDAGAMDILKEDYLVVTEKLDGSQIAFMNDGGRLRMRSRGKERDTNRGCQVDILFAPALATLQTAMEDGTMPEGVVFYGETLCKPKHSTLTYGRVPKGHISLFAARLPAGRWVRHAEYDDRFRGMAYALGVDTVPVIMYGTGFEVRESGVLTEEKTSHLGGCNREGVVVTGTVPHLLYGVEQPYRSVKFVSDRFRERNSATWVAENTYDGKWAALVKSFATEARWVKAVGRLKENGECTGTMRDMGRLIVDLKNDTFREEEEYMKQVILDIYTSKLKREVERELTRGFPEWYKAQLSIPEAIEGEV